MNQKIGVGASAVNLIAVIGFALAMLISSNFLSYLSSIFIAFSFVGMICAFVYYGEERTRVAAYCAMAFGVMYALCNSIVYFVQLSTVRNSLLTDQAETLLDFNQFGMMFHLDMLGYCLMSISTIFIGFTIEVKSRADRWLKWLLIVHGVFAISCFIIPILGLFGSATQGNELIGVLILEFWCLYFASIGILSMLHFVRKE
jgi:hypothetical protein